jgi:protoporphyrinogen IX oxidase
MQVALTLHIASLAVWSASLLAMPVLLARQAADPDRDARHRLGLAQRWLYAVLMTPSAVLTVAFGAWLIFERGFEGGWLPVKLALVLAMGLFHVYCGILLGTRTKPRAEYRPLFYYALLPVPASLVVAVTTLVTAKPF